MSIFACLFIFLKAVPGVGLEALSSSSSLSTLKTELRGRFLTGAACFPKTYMILRYRDIGIQVRKFHVSMKMIDTLIEMHTILNDD